MTAEREERTGIDIPNNNEAGSRGIPKRSAGKKFSPAAPGQRKLELILRSATLGCGKRAQRVSVRGGEREGREGGKKNFAQIFVDYLCCAGNG